MDTATLRMLIIVIAITFLLTAAIYNGLRPKLQSKWFTIWFDWSKKHTK